MKYIISTIFIFLASVDVSMCQDRECQIYLSYDSSFVFESKIEILNHNLELIDSFQGGIDTSILIKYNESSPTFLYLFVDSNYKNENLIIVDIDSMGIHLRESDSVKLDFYGSELNVLYQKFLREKHSFDSIADSIYNYATTNRSKLSKEERQELFEKYQLEKKKASDLKIQFENKSIEEFQESFVSLVIFNESFRFLKRSKEDYQELFKNIDPSLAEHFTLYNKIENLLSLNSLNVGDRFEPGIKLTDEINNPINLNDFINSNDSIFIFFWKEGCPHTPKLIKNLNELIGNREIDSRNVIGISYDSYKSDSKKKEIQSQTSFKCFFTQESSSLNFLYEIWITRTPYSLILHNGYIMNNGCRISDFIVKKTTN